MREILFRGKRIDNGEWVEGDLSYHVHDGEVYVFPGNGYDSSDNYEVDSETVCQYTGSTDRNGRKIFEGDILSAHLDNQHPEDMTYVQITCLKGQTLIQNKLSETEGYFSASPEKALFFAVSLDYLYFLVLSCRFGLSGNGRDFCHGDFVAWTDAHPLSG